MRSRKVLIYAAAAVVAILIGLGIGYWTLGRSRALTASTLLLHPPKPLAAFSLVSDRQTPFVITSLRGHWSLLYFGYTHCPDVCPTTLADLSKMTTLLTDLPPARQPQVYFISVDPKRDTPALLAKYVRYFNVNFIGVTGGVDQLQLLAKPLGVGFSYVPSNQSGNYTVDHTAVVFLINPQGLEQAIFTPPMIPARMAADYRTILDQYGDR